MVLVLQIMETLVMCSKNMRDLVDQINRNKN